MKTKNIILAVFLVALIVRIVVSFYNSNEKKAEFWEYGPLAENLITAKGYSLFYADGETLRTDYGQNSDAKPSAYMMPGYPLILAVLFLIFGKSALAVYLLQSLIAAFTAVVVYKLTLQISNLTTAVTAAAIYVFLPEIIYATVTIGPTVFYHLFISTVLYLLVKYDDDRTGTKQAAWLGFLFIALIYLRPAVIMFIILLFGYLIFKRRQKQVVIILLIITAGLSPWIVRNYIVFDKFIPLTTSAGLNVYRGHNPYYPGFWQDEEISKELKLFANDKDFELKMNKVFMSHAFNQIKNQPLREVKTSFEKLFHLWVYYPYDSRAFSKLYLIPWLILFSFFLLSLFLKFDFEKKKYLYIYLIAVSLNAVLFFALLRYQTIMKIAVIPLAAQGIILVWDLYKKKK